MCAVYRCGRCGRHGHKSEHCAAPRRFKGTCGACSRYGHMWRDCALSSRQPHLNVFTSSGECYVSEAYGADTIVIPQQQHRQPAVDLGGEDIPFEQPSDTMHHSIGISGGGRGDSDALGTDVPSGGGDNDEDDWNRGVTRQQQLDMQHNGGVVETSGAPGRGSGGDGEGGGGPLSGTFSGGDDGVVYGGFFALQLICSFTPNPSSQMLSAISSLFANRRPGSTIFLGDTGAVIHGVSSADCVYNRRHPRPWERYLMLGDGKYMTVDVYGDLNLDLHFEQDVRVTLTNVAVVPGLAFDIISFNRMQEKHEIILNGVGASMLGGRVRFKNFRVGNFIQATRVPHDDTSPHPPAMVAAMMRPGAPSSMDVNDFHNSLGHANIKTLYEAAKQLGQVDRDSFRVPSPGFPGGGAILGGGGAITSSRSWSSTASSPGATPDPLAAATSSRGGGFPAATPAASAVPRGGGIPPMFSSGAAPTPLAAATSSRGGGFPAATPAASAAPRGGGIPPMFSSGAVTTSATSSRGGGTPAAVPATSTSLAAATSSRSGGFPAATPAASAAPRREGIPPMSSSGAAATSAAVATSSRGGGIPSRFLRQHLPAAGVFPPRFQR